MAIDTLQFYIPRQYYSLEKDNKLDGGREYTNKITGEICTEKQFKNENNLYITIHQPDKNLCIHFSLPKLLHGTSQIETNDGDLKYLLPTLHNGLEKIGIQTDFDGALITRLDLCRNLSVEQKPSYYMAQLGRMTLPHFSHKATHEKGIKTETINFYNKQREFTAYDKFAETMAHKEKVIIDNNTLRIEYRLKNGKQVITQATRHLKQFINDFESNHTNKIIIDFLDKLKGSNRMTNTKLATNFLNSCLLTIAKSGSFDTLIDTENARINALSNRQHRYNEKIKMREKIANIQISQFDIIEYLKERIAA